MPVVSVDEMDMKRLMRAKHAEPQRELADFLSMQDSISAERERMMERLLQRETAKIRMDAGAGRRGSRHTGKIARDASFPHAFKRKWRRLENRMLRYAETMEKQASTSADTWIYDYRDALRNKEQKLLDELFRSDDELGKGEA